MAKSRDVQEINAGSMADIAFLLLIFFLVTTTMDQDSGIVRQLPPIVPPEDIPEKVIERNVFKVLVNSNDQLLVEEDFIEITELKDKAIEFMTNSGVFSDEEPDMNLTIRIWEDADAVRTKIGQLKAQLDADPESKEKELELKNWMAKLDAINFFGKYKKLDDAAVISLKNDNGTSYGMYVSVQNELTSALNELRDELTLKKFNKTYLELNKKDPKERRIIKAVRQIYPQRISEAEPNQ